MSTYLYININISNFKFVNTKQELASKNMSFRENLTLELKIICATDVTHSNMTDKIDVYAVASINGDNAQTQAVKTPIDYDGGSNPTWNHSVKFSVNER